MSGALGVILSFVAEAKHVVLIHGSWSRGEQLAPARAAFEERGYTAHTPTLRHHELPSHEGAMKVASLSLRDYTDDLVAFVNSLDSPPLLVGHSSFRVCVAGTGSGRDVRHPPFGLGVPLSHPTRDRAGRARVN
jgi:hypothetical protein